MKHKSKLQEKIVDKFASVPELNDFLQSEGGSNFLKSIRFEGLGPREKILSSLSKGVIFAILGVALIIIAQLFTEEMKYFAMFGIVTVAVGIGFLISTFISYKLSKKWGIINKDF